MAFGLAAGGALLLFGACGTSAVDVQACRTIEEARCERAQACGISLATPVHDGNNVDFCIRFYDDQCLHGLVTQQVPGTTAVNACVADINKSCTYVINPQASTNCSFLIPGLDASVSEDAGDSGADGAD
jgi:hypothetical protein